jgi:hypothetical protein
MTGTRKNSGIEEDCTTPATPYTPAFENLLKDSKQSTPTNRVTPLDGSNEGTPRKLLNRLSLQSKNLKATSGHNVLNIPYKSPQMRKALASDSLSSS